MKSTLRPCSIVVVAGNVKKSQSTKDSEPPPRITTNVKQNLQFLKLWKEFKSKQSSTPKPATSYPRKKVEKEDLPPDTELYKDPTLALYYTNQIVDCAAPVLLVDGYNVCGYWVKLKKHFSSGRLDIARQKLIDELVQFSLVREVKVVTVFDAMKSGLPTHKETLAGRWLLAVLDGERRREAAAIARFGGCVCSSLRVDIVFSGDSCADSWIEKEVVALKEDGCPKVWVVTSDHAQQHAAHGARADAADERLEVVESRLKPIEEKFTHQVASIGRAMAKAVSKAMMDTQKVITDNFAALFETEKKRPEEDRIRLEGRIDRLRRDQELQASMVARENEKFREEVKASIAAVATVPRNRPPVIQRRE
uniref:Uncharacterized protein n=1 Tax=Chenopodium quinoa TaxID=63459 RepID=A0A803N448_CHEQI